MKKPTLCVIFGGKSSEYEVSLRSAYGVITHIDTEKYDLVRLGITRYGEWYVFEGENGDILNDTWHKKDVVPVTFDLSKGYLVVLDRNVYAIEVDLFLPILHGEYGEDGRIQALFDIAGVKYVGCGAFCSHICMDKALAKAVAKEKGVRVAKGVVVNAKCKVQNAKLILPQSPAVTAPSEKEPLGCEVQNAKPLKADALKCKVQNAKCKIDNPPVNCVDTPLPRKGAEGGENAKCKVQNAKSTILPPSESVPLPCSKGGEEGAELDFPVFVKPTMCGSSVGVSKVEAAEDLALAVEEALKYGKEALIEEFIDGVEVEVGVLEIDGGLTVSELGTVKHNGIFYDYDTKYKSEENRYLIPAPVGKEVEKQLNEKAKTLFLALGCRGLSRFDFFVKGNGEVVFNEVNTMPGFTEKSMFPMMFKGLGLDYSQVVEAMIKNAIC